ncbi:spore cortex biosynthesis protein YabQ [Clostridium sp. MSJ-4]|uniref:Spore cortex biosynthesis protein YabQ n=1 Tax=Clostridium simiarum TaxID=2841506 RepID=A0ABS6F0T2_9CLOT|nr:MULTISPECIES: spore cortex biosynthesis protein YabQ [Clostridium]MBU5592095.1 spore cortex biosynthesis protein YabQ [Clostridium simiarum]
MIVPLVFQFKILLFSILAGFITGILFDFYRIIRGYNNNKVLVIIEDFLFWILASLIVFIFLLYTNYAFIGVYVYLYIILGIYLHLKIFSRYLLKIQYSLYRIIAKTFRLLFNYLSYPFKLIFYDENKK